MKNQKSIIVLSTIIFTLLNIPQILSMESAEKIELIKKVKHLINSGVSQNYRPLIDAFFQSTEIGLLEITDKILSYGIDIDVTFIEAIERGNVIAIQKLFSSQPSPQIIDYLTYILAHDKQDNLLKTYIHKLLNGESISTNKIFNLKSEWSENTAKILNDSFLIS